MKQTGKLDHVEANMRPGVITMDGMLGTDTRKLGDILLADDAIVKRLGTSHAAIAARLRELMEKGAAGLGIETLVEGRYVVRVDNVRGKLPCPFEEAVVQKTFVEVEDKETGQRLIFTDLNVHMIEAHGFYEGKGSAFRLEPATLAALLHVETEAADIVDGEIFRK